MNDNRIFIAVPVPLPLSQNIQVCLPGNEFLRRVDPGNYHITLQFIGPVDNLQEMIASFLTTSFNSFNVSLDRIGGFQKKEKLKIVYLTVSTGLGELSELAARFNSMFVPSEVGQFPIFTPHVTLCRNLKSSELTEAQDLLGFKLDQVFTFPVLTIGLYDSNGLGSTGRYKLLAEIRANHN